VNPTHEVLTTLTTGCDSERSGDPTGWQPVTAEPPVVDVLDRAFWLRNPHDAWTWCRANDPIHRDERSGIWCITKHADVPWVERHAELFSSDSAYRLNRVAGRVEH